MGKGFYKTTNQAPANIKKPAPAYLQPTANQTFTKPVSFAHCQTVEEKENYRIQLYNDNVIFLQSVLALLTDHDRPFLHEADLNKFLRFVNSKRPEIQDRVATLKYIRDNRAAWFANGTAGFMKANMIVLFEYIKNNDILIDRASEYLGQDIDLNFAVQKSILEPNFDFKSPQNPVRKSWDGIIRQLRQIHKPQDLYATTGF